MFLVDPFPIINHDAPAIFSWILKIQECNLVLDFSVGNNKGGAFSSTSISINYHPFLIYLLGVCKVCVGGTEERGDDERGGGGPL